MIHHGCQGIEFELRQRKFRYASTPKKMKEIKIKAARAKSKFRVTVRKFDSPPCAAKNILSTFIRQKEQAIIANAIRIKVPESTLEFMNRVANRNNNPQHNNAYNYESHSYNPIPEKRMLLSSSNAISFPRTKPESKTLSTMLQRMQMEIILLSINDSPPVSCNYQRNWGMADKLRLK